MDLSINTNDDEKKAFRSWSKKALQYVHKKHCKGFDVASYRVNTRIYTLLEKLQARNILLYMPFDFESDSKKLLLKLRKQKKKIFLPYIMEGIRFKMLALRLT